MNREIAHIYAIVQDTPDCNLSKVDLIKREIAKGGYRVLSDRIAESILVDNLFQEYFLIADAR